MKKVEVPLWAKNGSICWIEIRDKTGQEVLEYVEATVTIADHDKQIIKVKMGNNDSEEQVKPEQVFERIEDHKLVADLAAIPSLNDAELLKHLEVRYKQDYIHCFCGPTLVVINPYKRIDHEESQETWDEVHKHLKESTMNDCLPHLWTISAKCWDSLFKLGTNQAICISGESGAGKTESTKRCMAFVTKMNVSRQSIGAVPIEDKILACNPLLEAFGNAKTFRNDNSSRFGKYTVLYVDKHKKKVKGASIENYLLEKSRVVVLGKEERNYHIFYCLCRYGTAEQLKKLKLNNNGDSCDMSKFEYLNKSGVYTVPKINDQEFMEDVKGSLNNLEFTDDEQECIWKNVATILHLGNCEIESSTYVEGQSPCKVVRNQYWKNVIEILEIDENLFEMALTHKEIKVGASITRSPLSPSQCKNSLDSIAKEIYNRMFTWIVMKLNQTLVPEGDLSQFGTIGILDIFGFEIFEKNSLEQFFINFANERLQSLYIDYIFKNECRIFEEEGLAEYTQLIVYTDNKPIVNAIEFNKMPPGIFNLVDGACAMNKSDEKLHADIKNQHGNSTVISFPKFAKELSFIVKHTAREVEYLTDHFVDKNKDELSPFLKQAFDTSYQTIVQIFEMRSGLKNLPDVDPNKKVNPKEKYLGFKFRRDMNNLVNQLLACDCHFIRCIKPNEFKKSDFWNPHLALLQIQYMGMLDSLKVRKQSYPVRYSFAKFFEIYQDLDMGENGSKNFRILEQEGANFKNLAKDIFNFVEKKPTEKDVLYGSGRIFLQDDYKIYLDKILLQKQKKKKEALKVISQLYLQYEKRMDVQEFFIGQSKSIMISRDLLKSWTAKLDGLKFKNYIKILRTIQCKFRFVKEKRLKRYQSHNMIVILRYLSMYKFSQIIKYILYYKRKVQMMQAMLDSKIRDSKNRHCRAIVESLFQLTWKNISKEIISNSAKDVQRTFRSYLLRQKKIKEYQVLEKKIDERQEYDYSSTIQKQVRGYLVRARLERLNRAASKIQGFMRTKWMRSYFIKVAHSVKILQKWFKKMYIRHVQRREKMIPFMRENGNYNQNVAKLEDRILFGDQEELTDLENLDDYQKLPFYQKNQDINFGSKNYLKFIPPSPEIEIQPKVKFMSLLIDLDVYVDTTNCYEQTWAKDFVNFINKIHEKNKRLLNLEIGDTFTMAMTEDREVYSWGLNDQHQCGIDSHDFMTSVQRVKNLSSNPPKLISLGKEHGIMVDDSNHIFTWGGNREGQLGLNHCRKVNSIVVLDQFKETVKSIQTKENKTYLLNNKGNVYQWPSMVNEEKVFKPMKIQLDKIEISSISVGVDFCMLLSTSGILFGQGTNEQGELGLNDYEPRNKPQKITFFTNQNEKVVEVSCGYKHVICRTSLKKIFSWGMNNKGQLGHGDNITKPCPEAINITNRKGQRLTARSIQAGQQNCFILINDRNLYYTGKIGSSQKCSNIATKLKYEKKIHAQRVSDNFGPVRIVTKWSSMLSATYIIFTDFRNTKLSQINREKAIDQINGEWLLNSDLVIPLQSQILSKYMESKYMLSTSKKTAMINNKYSGDFISSQQYIPQQQMNDGQQVIQNQTNNVKQMQESKETALPEKSNFKKKQNNTKVKQSKTPVKKANQKNMAMQGDIQNKIQKIMKKDPNKLTAQEQQVLKMYQKMFN